MKHEHALSLEAFDDQVAWIPHWGTIFDKRSTEALAHFEAAKELVVQMQREGTVAADTFSPPQGFWVILPGATLGTLLLKVP